MRTSRGFGLAAIGLALLMLLCLGPGSAEATFPGRAGVIAVASGHQVRAYHPGTGTWTTVRKFSGTPAHPSYSANGARIVFDLTTNGVTSVYRMRSNGTYLTRLALGTSSASTYEPSFSPDGTHVVYVRNGQLWRMSANGANKQRIAVPQKIIHAYEPSYSPNGTWIVFSGITSSRQHIWAIHPSGAGLRQLTSGTRVDEHPQFSPGGGWVGYVRGQHVAMVRIDATSNHVLNKTLTAAPAAPIAFSPAGGKIAFIGRDAASNTWKLYELTTSDGAAASLTPATGYPAWQPLQ